MNAPGYPAGSHPPQRGEARVDPRLLAERVSRSLERAESYAIRLGRTNGSLSLGGIVTSAALTALTGWTSVAGPVFGSSVSAWRLTCILAAVLGFLSTVFMALSQQLRLGDRLARANECIGRLKSLDLSLFSNAQSVEEIWKEYSEILRQYPEELR
jgi:hypothetical protein